MITCPRCHRTIPADQFRQHILEHKGKKTSHQKESTGHITDQEQASYPRLQSYTDDPRIKELFEKLTASKPVKSNLSQDQIRTKFEDSLMDANVKYASLKIVATKEAIVAEVEFDEQRNLTLKYNPLSLRTVTETAIDGLLLHEACHVVTLPNTILKGWDTGDPEMNSFLGNSITNYNEYLAHVEFVKRFRSDSRYEGLKEQQLGLFPNFEEIVNMMKTGVSKLQKIGKSPNRFFVLQQLWSIVYDSLFFFMSGDNSFAAWCKDHSLNMLCVFSGWIYEDFEHIKALNLTHDETQDKVMRAAMLSAFVNPLKLLLLDKIEFEDGTKESHESMKQKGIDVDLVQLWEKRRLLYQKT